MPPILLRMTVGAAVLVGPLAAGAGTARSAVARQATRIRHHRDKAVAGIV